MSPFRRPSSSLCSPSSPTVNLCLPLLLPSFLLFLLVPFARGGTWLSFNQNSGGIDGGLIGALRGEYAADAMGSGGQMAAREGEQLLGLLRMCRQQKSIKRSQQNLEEICSALFQMAKEQRRRKRKGIFGGERRHPNQMVTAKRPFLPIGEEEDEEQLLWW